jgi:radical SAM protein with 4Fe4S-binding SPASM domain
MGIRTYWKYVKPIKIWNMALVWTTYIVSRLLKKPVHRGKPISISIEPTTSCNLRCPECPSGLRSFTRPTGMLAGEMNKKIIDELSPQLAYITYYFQGEPYLNPHFTEMVTYASKKKIFTATSTNAHYLDDENCRKTVESGLSRLIVSIDGLSAETYEKYRVGGDLQKVLEGTKNIVHWKRKLKSSTPEIVWQFIVFRHNEVDIPFLEKQAKAYGVDKVSIKTAQIYDFEHNTELIPLNSKYSRYTLRKGVYRIKNKLLNQCWRMWSSAVITWDGKIVPCCFDKDAKYQMGNLADNNFMSAWNGPSYYSFRKKILMSRSEIDICQNCTEGTKVFELD